MVCGDFNARCGGLSDMDGDLNRCSIDLVKNTHESRVLLVVLLI